MIISNSICLKVGQTLRNSEKERKRERKRWKRDWKKEDSNKSKEQKISCPKIRVKTTLHTDRRMGRYKYL